MDEVEERQAGFYRRTLDQGVQPAAVPEGAVGENAVRTALEHDERFLWRRNRSVDVNAFLDRQEAAGDADRVLRRGHVEGGNLDRR